MAVDDHALMARALALAENGLYTTTPNPRVGCVITDRHGTILGEGWTQPAGQNHAEIQALQDARRKGHDLRGATAYVTLEPCSHFGRTPPCCNALIDAGIARVVAAVEDPNPLVAGKGLEKLKAAGIEVSTGVGADAAREINAGFFSRILRGRPFVRMKIAASLDGKTALANGESKWITGDAARADGHHWRARSCAVLTGIGTVLADDPALNVRAVVTPRQPRRIIVDSHLRTPPTAKILIGGNTLIAYSHGNTDKQSALTEAGAALRASGGADGRIDLAGLLAALGTEGCNELLVEAGATLNAAFIQAGLVDEYLIYLAPRFLGDPARGLARLPDYHSMAEPPRLCFTTCTPVGEDLRILARPASNRPASD